MQARGVEPLNNAFVGVGFGANTYRNDVERYFGNVNLNASIDVGKWVLDAIGLQVHLAEIKGTNSKGITSFYECADFNIMVDPLKLRDPFRFENRWAFFLYAGMGLTHRKENSQQDADNDFSPSDEELANLLEEGEDAEDEDSDADEEVELILGDSKLGARCEPGQPGTGPSLCPRRPLRKSSFMSLFRCVPVLTSVTRCVLSHV